ncbi:MAG: VTC domain-containing protein, partial [Lentisphaeria bacterium]|nr:VTC domain-containing protein [Lentisphaeria bacterium]
GKKSLPITRQQCEAILAGEYGFLLHRQEDFAAELYAALRIEGWRPRVLVDYDREPFIFPLEDVRITIDRNIRTGLRCTDLFNPHAPTFPASSGSEAGPGGRASSSGAETGSGGRASSSGASSAASAAAAPPGGEVLEIAEYPAASNRRSPGGFFVSCRRI